MLAAFGFVNEKLHRSVRIDHSLEPVSLVKPVRVARAEPKQTHTFQLWMVQYRLEQELRDAPASIFGDYEDVGEISEHGTIGDEPRKPDLAPVAIRAEAQGMADGSLDDLARPARRPIRSGEEAVHEADVYSRRIGGNLDVRQAPPPSAR